MLPGKTADKTTLRGFLERIERQYGKARRIWLMARGVPTEEVLAEMRAADPPVHYLVGTPKGRLTRLEKHLIVQPWQQARPGVQVKLLAQEGELYVLAQSRDRVAKERAMRRRQLKRLWARLKQLSTMRLTREELLMKLGAARDQSRTAWRLVTIEIATEDATFSYRLDRNKLRQTRLREGRPHRVTSVQCIGPGDGRGRLCHQIRPYGRADFLVGLIVFVVLTVRTLLILDFGKIEDVPAARHLRGRVPGVGRTYLPLKPDLSPAKSRFLPRVLPEAGTSVKSRQ